jgi:hypothetical protein
MGRGFERVESDVRRVELGLPGVAAGRHDAGSFGEVVAYVGLGPQPEAGDG